MFCIDINNMRVCIRKFFKKDTTEYIRVRTAYFGKSECLEHVNNRQLWVHSPSLERGGISVISRKEYVALFNGVVAGGTV